MMHFNSMINIENFYNFRTFNLSSNCLRCISVQRGSCKHKQWKKTIFFFQRAQQIESNDL